MTEFLNLLEKTKPMSTNELNHGLIQRIDETKLPSKLSISKSMRTSESVAGSRGGSMLELKEAVEEPGEEAGEGEKEDKPHVDLSSDEEGLEIEEVIEESRAERIKRSSLQRVQTLKTVFSREKMDRTRKTRQKTKENIEKTKQKTKENLEKTRHNIEKKMGKLGTRMSVNPERKQKMKTSSDKMKKAFTPDHVVYARSKTAVYKVPPFTFHVKKIREGAVEVVQGTEMVEVSRDIEALDEIEGERGWTL
uniref:Caveolae associated protein 1b n=1 Tax=Oryzias sinensis TaxID=183150 RepID=A0A8C7ZYF3_9TELE